MARDDQHTTTGPEAGYGETSAFRPAKPEPVLARMTLVAAAVLSLAVAGSPEAYELAAMLALLVAACFLVARLLQLGWIADYFSRPVLIGYIHGVAVVLVIGQLGKMLGLSVDAREPLEQLWEALRELGDVSGATLEVGVTTLAALLLLRLLVPLVPAALLVVIAAIALSWGLDFESHGVAVVGSIPSGLPSFTLPAPPLGDVVRLAPAAVGIFLVSFADEILTARAFAGRHNQNVRASQELFAMGAANAAAGFTQGFSIGASGSRTAVNDAMGARTQIAGLFAAGTIVVILFFLTEPRSTCRRRCWVLSSSPPRSGSSTQPRGVHWLRSTASRPRSPRLQPPAS